MMTVDVANHLELLRRQSIPYIVSDSGVITGGPQDLDGDDKLYSRIKPIVESMIPFVVHEEIVNAAKERRKPDVVHTELTPYWWGKEIHWNHTARIWRAAAPQIKAIVVSDNAERLAEYETYRLACEQGVAVPPAKK